MTEKKYLAIGHFRELENVTCVSSLGSSIKDFRKELSGNAFIPYVVITEEKFHNLKNMDSFELYEAVKKMTTNYRVWDVVTDYISQCFDIMEEKLNRA